MQSDPKTPSLRPVQSLTLGELFQECLAMAAQKAKNQLAADRLHRLHHKIEYEPHTDRSQEIPSNSGFPEMQSKDVCDRTKG